MNYVIIFCSLAFGAFAFVMMADVSGGSNIDYKTATPEERQAWMDDKAETLKTAAKFFLPSGRGPKALNFYLKEIVTRPESRQMEMIVDVRVPYGAEVGTLPRSKFLDTFCKNYISAGFYKQRIELVVKFLNKKRGTLIDRISVKPRDCEWHAEQRAKNS